MRWHGISLTGTMLGRLHAQAAWGAATGSMEVRLTNCEPQCDCPQAGVCSTSPIVAQEPGYLGPGYHNVAGARRFRAQLAYNTAGAGESERGYFGHATPEGYRAIDRARAAGFRGCAVGENLATGALYPDAVVASWLESPKHCEILREAASSTAGIALDRHGAIPCWVFVAGD